LFTLSINSFSVKISAGLLLIKCLENRKRFGIASLDIMKSKNPRKKAAEYAFILNNDNNIIPNIVKRKRKTIKPTITAKGENLY
jgi:hypothetical protein